jgi:hypothetical protein
MSTDIRPVPVFGKRSTDEVWARAQHEERELAICPWRFSACLAGLVAASFLLLLDAVMLLGGGGKGLGLAGGLAAWLAGGPGLIAGMILLVPAALLAQGACALLGIGLSGQPVVLVDTAGVMVNSRGGGIIMAWEEVARIRLAPGFARFERKPGAVVRMCSGPAYDKARALAPLVLVAGGSAALRQAVAEIRPDMARRLGI